MYSRMYICLIYQFQLILFVLKPDVKSDVCVCLSDVVIVVAFFFFFKEGWRLFCVCVFCFVGWCFVFVCVRACVCVCVCKISEENVIYFICLQYLWYDIKHFIDRLLKKKKKKKKKKNCLNTYRETA